ncbi:hypothetical protein [Pyxidicoccus caerfyrddinensis]|jgi:hypothetical protein|uniref:hypothetical protein n=1 Tax=Pyxidicoccus caerfyrddinensis TaxID=2709663 RepID=UPI0013DA5007|nr:hypothetical protein [Pyxidicoccus caerfyrddinensis]
MSPLSLPAKLRSWLGSSRLPVPLLLTVSACGLGAPRPRGLRALTVIPVLLGLASLGVLGWKAAQARRITAGTPGAARSRVPFAFTWQMSEEIVASAASGH